jgi:hypothetical protein
MDSLHERKIARPARHNAIRAPLNAPADRKGFQEL